MNINYGLIPTVVTDKNGRVTTVHKKAQSLSASAMLPAPSAGQSLVELRGPAYQALLDNYSSRGIALSKIEDQRVNFFLRKMDKTHLMQLPLILKPANDLANGVADDMLVGTDKEWIWERIHFYRVTNSDNYWKTASETYALASYAPVNMHSPLADADEYTTKICVALMDVARIFDESAEDRSPYMTYSSHPSGYPITIIDDKALVYFIATQPDNAKAIAETVVKYGTTDHSTINGILNGITPSLAEGNL